MICNHGHLYRCAPPCNRYRNWRSLQCACHCYNDLTEKKAGEKIKNAVQGLFTFATYGVGMFIGTWFSGRIADAYQVGEGHDWQRIWFVPAYIAAGVLVYFILFFREKKQIAPAV